MPAQLLLHEAWPLAQERGLTRIGISVTGLSPADNVQLALPFSDRDTARLDETLDAIHKRFGAGSIRRAGNLRRGLAEVPMLPE